MISKLQSFESINLPITEIILNETVCVNFIAKDYGPQNLDKVMTQDSVVTKNIWERKIDLIVNWDNVINASYCVL